MVAKNARWVEVGRKRSAVGCPVGQSVVARRVRGVVAMGGRSAVGNQGCSIAGYWLVVHSVVAKHVRGVGVMGQRWAVGRRVVGRWVVAKIARWVET